jgi:hypothetical protein
MFKLMNRLTAPCLLHKKAAITALFYQEQILLAGRGGFVDGHLLPNGESHTRTISNTLFAIVPT